MVATEGVVPGQPIHEHQAMRRDEWPGLLGHHLVRAHHSVRVDDALRHSSGARSEKHLGDSIGPDAGERVCHRAGWRSGEKFRQQRCRHPLRRIGANDQLAVAEIEGSQCTREGLADCGVDEARSNRSEDVLQLLMVLAHERIGDGDRCDRDTGDIGTECKKRVIDAVARQDHERAIRTAAPIEQSLGDRVRLLARSSESEAPPSASVISLDQEITLGMRRRLLSKEVGESRGVLAQRNRRRELERAIRQIAALDQGRRELKRLERRLAWLLIRTDAEIVMAHAIVLE